MIRASNRFSPKTKVVDLFFLYNFYFGQISCSHMKFGVSTSRIRVKIIQTKKQCLHCARHCDAPTPYQRLWPAASFHMSAIACERRSSPRGRPRTFLPRPVLPFHPHPRARAELGRAESPSLVAPATARHPASIHRAPSCATSPRSSSIPPRTRPCPTPAEIELRPPLAIADLRQAPPRASPSRRRPPSGHPPFQIESRRYERSCPRADR